ncbi:MAG: hypothetical protein DME57_04240 [Verrucomicrobia bacterium]|nr:MAG: hypothetical protein DME57_04240 [Verrucomicrobiota bacterium]
MSILNQTFRLLGNLFLPLWNRIWRHRRLPPIARIPAGTPRVDLSVRGCYVGSLRSSDRRVCNA